MRISLNLLPPEKKRALHAAFSLVRASNLLWACCVVAMFCTVTLVGVRMMFSGTRNDIASSVAATENKETTDFAAKTRQMNTYLKRIDEIETRTVAWSAMLRTLAESAPSGVLFTNVRVDPPDLVHLTGTAATRADVLQLKAALESSPSFTAVKAPLSNILSQRDVTFDFDMRYVPPVTR